MLILTRKCNQSIMIGNTEVKVVQLRHGQVRLGITAPDDVNIFRSELQPWRGTKKRGNKNI
jgi:carbon storage regulator